MHSRSAIVGEVLSGPGRVARTPRRSGKLGSGFFENSCRVHPSATTCSGRPPLGGRSTDTPLPSKRAVVVTDSSISRTGKQTPATRFMGSSSRSLHRSCCQAYSSVTNDGTDADNAPVRASRRSLARWRWSRLSGPTRAAHSNRENVTWPAAAQRNRGGMEAMLLIPRPSIQRRVLPAGAVRMKVPLDRGVPEGERTVVQASQPSRQHARLRYPCREFGLADVLVHRCGQFNRAAGRHGWRRWRHGGRTPNHQKRQNDRRMGRCGTGHHVPSHT